MEIPPENTMTAVDEFAINAESDQTITLADPGVRRKMKVLIVDDDKTILCVLSQILSYMGFDVIEAGNGYEGRDIFLSTSLDLVITDLEMPGMDGSMLASLIKKESPQTPVIMATGLQEEVAMKKIKKKCIDTILFKPFRINELEEKIQTTLGVNL